MFKRILPLIIIIEIIIVVLLFAKIFNNYSKSIFSINHSSIKRSHQSNLHYYYEYQANSKISNIILNSDQKTRYSINNDTLHEEKEYSITKPDNTYRIIALGDSFTFGAFVETKDNWTEVLEDLLNKKKLDKSNLNYEVINLAVPNFQIQEQVERYRIRGQKYHPDMIIWFVKDDDINQINEIMLPKVEQYDQLFNKLKISKIFKYFGDHHFSWTLAQKELTYFLGKDKILTMQKQYLNKINEYFNQDLVVLTLSNIQPDNKKLLLDFIKSRNKKFPTKYLEFDIKQYDHFKNDYHPTIIGHKRIANFLFNNLITTVP